VPFFFFFFFESYGLQAPPPHTPPPPPPTRSQTETKTSRCIYSPRRFLSLGDLPPRISGQSFWGLLVPLQLSQYLDFFFVFFLHTGENISLPVWPRPPAATNLLRFAGSLHTFPNTFSRHSRYVPAILSNPSSASPNLDTRFLRRTQRTEERPIPLPPRSTFLGTPIWLLLHLFLSHDCSEHPPVNLSSRRIVASSHILAKPISTLRLQRVKVTFFLSSFSPNFRSLTGHVSFESATMSLRRYDSLRYA